MSKYHALRDHLNALASTRWNATFQEIEEILGFSLPVSAYKHPAWWANEVSGTHVQKAGWIDAGWRTENPNLLRRSVTFVRV